MGFFSRSKENSANSSSASVDKTKPPLTTDLYTVPPPGVKPTKKWTYDEDQLAQVSFHQCPWSNTNMHRSRSSRRYVCMGLA